MDPTPIYREDMRDGVPMTALRSLHEVLATLCGEVRRDAARGTGILEHVLCQDPPRELVGIVAELGMWSEALGRQLCLADDCIAAGPRARGAEYRDPLPESRVIVQRIHAAVGHLADVLASWCGAAEMQADALDEAARRVATGTARVEDGSGVLVVRPIGPTMRDGEPA